MPKKAPKKIRTGTTAFGIRAAERAAKIMARKADLGETTEVQTKPNARARKEAARKREEAQIKNRRDTQKELGEEVGYTKLISKKRKVTRKTKKKKVIRRTRKA